MNDKIFLTPKEILEKEFKIDARGYRMEEVDKFLDIVIKDYTEFLQIIKKLEKENANLTSECNKLEAGQRALKEDLTAASDNGRKLSVNTLNWRFLCHEENKELYNSKACYTRL